MGKFEIIVDSTCDFEPERYGEFGVHMIPFHVSPNGRDYGRDWTEIDPRKFTMDLLNNDDYVPKTSTPAPEEFTDIFEAARNNGKGVLCLCATQTLTSVIRTVEAAKSAFLEKYPDAEIEVMDTQLMSVGFSSFLMEAVKLRDEGVSLSEAFKRLIKARDESTIFFLTGGTKYLRLGGRIGKVAGVATEMLSIKPLIVLKAGEIMPFGMLRARGKAPAKLTQALKEHIASMGFKLADLSLWIGASHDVWNELAALKEYIERELGIKLCPERILVGAAVVAHAGPGILGVSVIRRV